jgi:hypothetical protein
MLSSKRHFTVVIDSKEHGLYVSSTPSSAARKAVSKLCADNKKKKVEFSIRETTQGSNKKVYGPYIGYMQKLEGRVILYAVKVLLVKKPSKKVGYKMSGGVLISKDFIIERDYQDLDDIPLLFYKKQFTGNNYLFFGRKEYNNLVNKVFTYEYAVYLSSHFFGDPTIKFKKFNYSSKEIEDCIYTSIPKEKLIQILRIINLFTVSNQDELRPIYMLIDHYFKQKVTQTNWVEAMFYRNK